MIGAAVFVARTPGGIETTWDLIRHPHSLLEAPFDHFTALPIRSTTGYPGPSPNIDTVAAAAILVLLGVLQVFSIAASIVRARTRRRARG